MKIKIIDKNGVIHGGKVISEGTVIEIEKGPHADIWLRFKQAEILPEEKPKK